MSWELSTTHLLKQIAAEVSSTVRYYDRLVQWLPHESDRGELLEAIDCPRKERVGESQALPDFSDDQRERSAVLLYANFNYDFDIQKILMQIKPKLSRTSRVLAVSYNPYLRWLFSLAQRLGLREAELPTTFVTRSVLMGIAKLSGFCVTTPRARTFSTASRTRRV